MVANGRKIWNSYEIGRQSLNVRVGERCNIYFSQKQLLNIPNFHLMTETEEL